MNKQEKKSDYIIKDLNIEDILPVKIEDIHISIIENRYTFQLPTNFTKEKFIDWKKGRGGIFSKDLKKFSKNKLFFENKYLLVEEEQEKYIIRLIENKEIPVFKKFNLINGKIGDKFYMKLINLSKKGEKFKNAEIYIDNQDNFLDGEESSIINHIPQILEEEDSFNPVRMPLFED